LIREGEVVLNQRLAKTAVSTLLFTAVMILVTPSTAQVVGEQVVVYEADFFARYQPSTAMDMVASYLAFS